MEENKIYLGDANIIMADIPDHTVDIIFTDPPYPKETWLQAYQALCNHAPRILKPSGWLISYSGHYNLDKVMRMFGDAGLIYYWLDIQLNEGPSAMVFARNVICGYKPILIYQNPPLKINEMGFYDVIRSQAQKSEHIWQQSLDDVLFILRRFTKPGQLLVEPFCGSGTTLSGAKQCGLRWIACEIDPHTHQIAINRQIRESLFDEF
jgi:site-specific DNA-methyltransferase (adenine-specific)